MKMFVSPSFTSFLILPQIPKKEDTENSSYHSYICLIPEKFEHHNENACFTLFLLLFSFSPKYLKKENTENSSYHSYVSLT